MKVILCVSLCFWVALALPEKEGRDWLKFAKERHLFAKRSSNNGTSRANLRVLGGRETVPHEYPFQTAIFANNGGFCGGTLISRNYILTAASCCDGAGSFGIFLGVHDLEDYEDIELLLETSRYKIHELWNSVNNENDICLIRLPIAVTYNKKIQPVVLNSSYRNLDGNTGTIIGWGKTTATSGSISPVLNKANASILPNWKCNLYFPGVIKNTHICTLDSFKGICNGDNGGPLINSGVQVGIASFGKKSCSTSAPNGFTRVLEYRNWIIQNSDARF